MLLQNLIRMKMLQKYTLQSNHFEQELYHLNHLNEFQYHPMIVMMKVKV